VRVVVIALAIAGCGRVAFDPLASTDAGSMTDDAEGDGQKALTCTAESFDTPDVQWTFWADAGFAAIFTNGQLQFTVPANTDGYAGIDLTPNREFRGGRLIVEVPQVAAINNEEIAMLVRGSAGNSFGISFSEGGVVFQVTRNAAVDAMMTRGYDPVDHRWWKIEHLVASNMLEFATSRDAATWTVQLTAAASVPVESVIIQLESGAYLGGNPSPGIPRFDNLTYCLP
jgi:hypothetical protein